MSERKGRARLLTWNIHAAVGADRRYSLERVVDLVQRHDPDIVALQEIDARGRAAEASPFARLAAALGSHAAEARTISAPDGDYGHAIISRWPLANTVLHDLTAFEREPRFAIETEVETPWGVMHLAAVHLGLQLRERRHQAAILAGIAARPFATTVMMGDFNEWSSHGAVRQALARQLPARTRHRTFPARLPLLMLDRIYCRPHDALIASWVDRHARTTSDHLPVVADIRLSEAGI